MCTCTRRELSILCPLQLQNYSSAISLQGIKPIFWASLLPTRLLSPLLSFLAAMLSSRPHQHHLYVDKENVLSLPVHPLTTARKGSASYTSTQASAFLAAKTPGLKQSLQQGAARTVNRNGSTIKSVSKGASGPQTTAVEQGARILGAKDGNNRQRVAQTVAKEKNTGKAGDVVDCGEMGMSFQAVQLGGQC